MTEYVWCILWWWYASTSDKEELQQSNFEVMFDCGLREQFDLVWSLGIEFDYEGLLRGDYTPQQFQEMYKQEYQDELTQYFSGILAAGIE